MPALRPASQAGPMRNLREGTSVAYMPTIPLLAELFRFLLQIPPLRFGIVFIPLFRPFPGHGNA